MFSRIGSDVRVAASAAGLDWCGVGSWLDEEELDTQPRERAATWTKARDLKWITRSIPFRFNELGIHAPSACTGCTRVHGAAREKRGCSSQEFTLPTWLVLLPLQRACRPGLACDSENKHAGPGKLPGPACNQVPNSRSLVEGLDLTRAPGLIEPGLEGAVES